MKLRNKKTGEIVDAVFTNARGNIIIHDAKQSLCGNNFHEYETLEELNEDWGDYKEPLIKDEKIRKAVRAWAEANSYDNETNLLCQMCYQSTWFESVDKHENEIHFDGQQSGVEDGQMYTIEELCGGEE